jgi:ribosomal protein L32
MLLDSFVNEDGETLVECPQCHEYDSETQILDHGVCHECVRINMEKECEKLK